MPDWVVGIMLLAVAASSAVVTAVLSAIMTYRGFMRGDGLSDALFRAVTEGMATAFIGFCVAFASWLAYRRLQRFLEAP